MKVLALNGSPRMRASSTFHMLQPLLEGMEAAGAETEVIHLRKLDLKSCIGCYTCWVRTPGKCIFHDKDNMAGALELYNEADLVIFGTPLYHFSMSGILKDFIDRTLVRIEPWLIPHPDLPDMTFHPERFHKPKKMMLVSPCGFPEFEHFDSLVATFRQMASMERMEYVGEILRPAAETLSRKTHQGLFGAYYDVLRQTGEQIITAGSISGDLQEQLRKDLFPGGKQAFYGLAENYWTQQMDRFKVPEEERHVEAILASDLDGVPYVPGIKPADTAEDIQRATNEELMNYLAGMFNPQAIPELRATIQFIFSVGQDGDFKPGPNYWYMNINEGVCSIHEGTTAVPSLTIRTPNEVWQRIGEGQLDAIAAFTDGEFEAEGSMVLMSQFPAVFQYPQPETQQSGPVDLDEVMLGMSQVFDASVAPDLEATIEFVLGGSGGGIYNFLIRDGECAVHPGSVPDATLTINAPADTWVAITRGELDGQEAFMSGQYRATGDMSLMIRFAELFPVASIPDNSPARSAAETAVETGSVTGEEALKNCHDTIAGMANVFNPGVAGEMVADVQFNVSGAEPGTYYLQINNGSCSFNEGSSSEPTLVINTPSEVWLAVSRGNLEGQVAFMEQKYTAEGDFSLLMKFSQLFPS